MITLVETDVVRFWITQPLSDGCEVPCSQHLFRDCNVLKKRDLRLKKPRVYRYSGRLIRGRYGYYHVSCLDGRARYGLCLHCTKRAERETPQTLAGAQGPAPR